jgi:hypothetical protein
MQNSVDSPRVASAASRIRSIQRWTWIPLLGFLIVAATYAFLSYFFEGLRPVIEVVLGVFLWPGRLLLTYIPLPEIGYEQPLNGFIVTMLSTLAWSFAVILLGAFLGALAPSGSPKTRD